MQVCVIGAGGHAKVVISTVLAAGYEVIACYDDDPNRFGTTVGGVKVFGPISMFAENPIAPCCIAIGDNRRRATVARNLDHTEFVSAVHPAATIHESVVMGDGTVIFAGAIVQPDSRIGSHVIINTHSSIDHDCQIGDFAHVAPGAAIAGGVTIGEGTLVGVGAQAIPGVHVREWVIIGAGSAVIRDIRPCTTVVGVPAEDIRKTHTRLK